MPKASPAFTRFNAGEWSPRMRGRVDLPRYGASLQTMRNALPTIQGSALKRPGTRFVRQSPQLSPAFSATGAFSLTTAEIDTKIEVSLPFNPNVVILWGTKRTALFDSLGTDSHAGFFGVVADDGQGCISWRSEDAVGTTNTVQYMDNRSAVVVLQDTTDAVEGRAKVDRLINGFRLNIDAVFGDTYTVRYWAFRVRNSSVHFFEGATSTGAQAVGPFQFDPDSAIFLGQAAAFNAVENIAKPSIGVVAGSGLDQYGLGMYSSDAVGTSNTYRYSRTGEPLLDINSTSPQARGSVTSIADGFINVNWAEVSGAAVKYMALVMDSDGAMEAFDFQTLTNTSSDIDVTGMAGRPSGGMIFSHGAAESSSDTMDGQAKMSIGSFTSPANQGGFGWNDTDAVGTTTGAEVVSFDSVYSRIADNSTAVEGSCQVTAINSDGLTLQMDDADPNQAFCFGLALTGVNRVNDKVRMVPFEFNATDAHALEFGQYYVTVYTDGGVQLESPIAITGASQANPVRITSVGHSLLNGDEVLIESIVGMTELNGNYYYVDNVSETGFDLYDIYGNSIDGTGFTAYSSGGTSKRVFTIGTHLSSDDLDSIDWFQSADILYIAQPDRDPAKLSRFANADWSFTPITFDRPPFQPENIEEDDYIIAEAVSGSSVNLTSTEGKFLRGHRGGFIRIASRFQSNLHEWKPSSADVDTPVNGNLWYEDNVYEVINKNGHTTKTGPTPPIHKFGTKSDGNWTLRFKNNGSGYLRIKEILDANYAIGEVIDELPDEAVSPRVTITSVSNTTPPRVTATAHGLQTGDKVWLDEITGSASVFNKRIFTVTQVNANNYDLDDTVAVGTGTGGFSQRAFTGQTHDVEQFVDHDLWSFGAFSEQNGYPRSVTIFEDRLYWGGTRGLPQGFWASNSGDFENHTPSAFSVEGSLLSTLSTGDPIEWMRQQNSLLIGLSQSEFGSPRDSDPLAPDTLFTIRKKSAYGSRRSVRPLQIENQVLLAQRSGRELREVSFDIDSGDLSGANLALLAEHLTIGIIEDMAFEGQPNRIVWVLLEDGNMHALTYERAEEVIAWSEHQLGGTVQRIESTIVIPDETGTRDEAWMAVRRTVNGNTVRHIERMTRAWRGDESIEDAFFVDSGLSYDGSPATVFSGLDHLEGESVAVLADGVASTATVSSGSVTLASSASKVAIGLPYTMQVLTQTIEAGAATGSSQGKIQKITSIVIRLEDTGKGLKYGPSLSRLRGTVPGEVGVLFSGDTKLLPWESGNERGVAVAIQHDTPLPCTVNAIFTDMGTQD